jgi:hypothetical protein
MPDLPETQPVPEGIGPGGTALWHAITTDYHLEEHELALLEQCARCKDRLNDLHAAITTDGVLIPTHDGDLKPHPAVIEERQQARSLGQLLAQLRVPAGEMGDHQQGARPQRRGTRGVYMVAK